MAAQGESVVFLVDVDDTLLDNDRFRADVEAHLAADFDDPYADRLYAGALEVLAHLGASGTTVVVSDGDAVFQPRKIERAGIREVVGGDVLVYVHKEEELGDVERRYPADRYVLVDDKLRILTAAKRYWGEHVTTVLPLQAQFANDPELAAANPAADVTVERIADLLELDPRELGRV